MINRPRVGGLNVNIRLNGFHHKVKVYLVSLLCALNVVYSSKSLRQGQHPKQLHAHFSCKIRNKESLFRRINYRGKQWFSLPECNIIICMVTEFRRIWHHRFVFSRWGLGLIYWIPALASLFPWSWWMGGFSRKGTWRETTGHDTWS